MAWRQDDNINRVQAVFVFLCCVGMTHCILQDTAALNQVFLDAVGKTSLQKVIKTSPDSGLNGSCFDPANGYSNLRDCIVTKCMGTEDLGKLYNITVDSPLPAADLKTVTPGLLHVLSQKTTCSSEVKEQASPSTAETWGYSFLFVTIINLLSLFGALVLPCMNLKIYKRVLMFMVALAVGTLVGSGLLVLIPEALHLTEGEDLDFLWKVTTVMGGIYLFFVLERVMRIINQRREDSRDLKRQDEMAMEGAFTATFHSKAPENPVGITKNLDALENKQTGLCNEGYSKDDETSNSSDLNKQNGAVKSEHSIVEHKRIAPVAYMIIFGDALHNLIDGLSIGAAFTDSVLLGISVCVAVMCEELPHELGDFAILLNSGLRFRKALLYNFLSSLSCYVGLVIGIVLGENTEANTWIFAIAGGMFLYISLADMLPEMNSAADSEDGKEFGDINTFILQNVGLLVGFGIILILAVYAGEINFE